MATDSQRNDRELVYGIDDVPKPLIKSIGFGLQHILTMFGATVAVPLLVGPAMKASPSQIALLVSTCMLAAGLSTLVQVNFGTRLPIIQGTSFSFIGPMLAIVAAVNASAEVSMQYIAGAIILGAVVEMVLGFTGLIGAVKRLVTPVVIGPTITLIGLGLFEAGAPQAGQNWFLAGIVIVLTFVFSFNRGFKKNSVFRLLPGIIIYSGCLFSSF